ncbi:hypothetical protein L1987_89698 [Smallanthus sonchifolius]|nr:hypothetical protein L1987_89698 [Smallanthus sonchifolius]
MLARPAKPYLLGGGLFGTLEKFLYLGDQVRRELRGYAVDMLFPIIFKLFAYVMGEVPADVFEDIQKDVRDMEGCFGFDLRWVHARLGAVAKARFDTHHLEEYAQTSAALEKATSALAQLEGELSRRSETASAHLGEQLSESSALMEFRQLSVSINLMEYLLHKENCINQWHEGVESGTERLSKPKQRHSFSSCKDDSC